MGTSHNLSVTTNNHAITGVAAYADITARDADTSFHSTSTNVDKVVRIESPLSFYILTSITPTWLEFTSTSSDEWTELGDTPSSITANLVVQGNSAGTALEFGQALDTDDSPTFAALTVIGAINNATLTDDLTLFNLFVGFDAGAAITVGSSNTAVGHQALTSSLDGDDNTAVGFKALFTNLAGLENTAVGNQALFANTTGNDNDAFGFLALNSNTTGSNNAAFGSAALEKNTTGTDNLAMGVSALGANILGRRNTVIGPAAGFDMLSATLTGENTLLGYNTGRGITTGVQNTILGANVIGLSATLSNNIILADGAGVTRLQFDSSGDGVIGGSFQVTGARLDSSGSAGTSGQILSSTVTGTDWIDEVGSGTVTNTGTLTDNFLVRGNGGVDIDVGSISMDSGGTRLRAGAGTELLPTYAFTSNTNRGMYDTGTSLRFADDGFDVLELIAPANSTNFLQINATDGTVQATVRIIPVGTETDIALQIDSQGDSVVNIGPSGGNVTLGAFNKGVFVGTDGAVGLGNAGTFSVSDGLIVKIRAESPFTKTSLSIRSPFSETQHLLLGINNTGVNNGDAFITADGTTELVLSTSSGEAIGISGQDVTIVGDLTVSGTTTTIDTTTLLVEDKNIELGNVTTPTDVTADGGGITLLGATSKTILWIDSTDSWTFNQQIDAGTNKIINVVDPTNAQDAATKNYVDGQGFVTTSDTLTDNFLVRGNGTADVDIGNIFMSSDGNDLTVPGDMNLSTAGSVYKVGGITVLDADSAQKNLLVGVNAGVASTTGNGLTAVGHNALQTNLTGNDNTAVGASALFLTTASENTAVGSTALMLNSTGENNAAFGHAALNVNTTGSNNTAIGSDALGSNTAGDFNLGAGVNALGSNILGRRNIAFGSSAGFDIISATLTGENTLIGYNTGRGITTGVQNTILGANVIGLSATLSNNIILADGAGVIRFQFDSSGDGVIGGGLQVTGAFSDTSGDPGTSGQVLSSTVTGTNWIDVERI